MMLNYTIKGYDIIYALSSFFYNTFASASPQTFSIDQNGIVVLLRLNGSNLHKTEVEIPKKRHKHETPRPLGYEDKRKKTRLYSCNPLKAHFYTVNWGLQGYTLIFFFC